MSTRPRNAEQGNWYERVVGEAGGTVSGGGQGGGYVDMLTRDSSKLYKPIIIQTF